MDAKLRPLVADLISLPTPLSTSTLEGEEGSMHRRLDQWSRSAKPTTIHGCAQSGDLIKVQKLLRENPSFLNGKNADPWFIKSAAQNQKQ
ncbi:hypothetical protein EV1_031914 [Malus domestica]